MMLISFLKKMRRLLGFEFGIRRLSSSIEKEMLRLQAMEGPIPAESD